MTPCKAIRGDDRNVGIESMEIVKQLDSCNIIAMAYISVKYKQFSFEENPGLITWIQLFLIKYIDSIEERPAWTNDMKEEWVMNSEIEIYKYFLDETILDEEGKITWSINFIDKALNELNIMTLEQFALYIGEDISSDVDFERLKKILLNIKLMLEGIDPIKTY
jgi:methionyl-tRNA formyltransferase